VRIIILTIIIILESHSVGAYHNNIVLSSLIKENVSSESFGMIWSETQRLLASDGAPCDYFGVSVSLLGDTVLIGASYDDNLCGSAYVFTLNGAVWTQQAKLLAFDGGVQDYFGYPVSLQNDIALIGAPGDDIGKGSVYVFTRNGTTWLPEGKLFASDAESMDNFGVVSIFGDTTLIGAPRDDDNGDNSGSAYVFKREGNIWNQQAKLLSLDGAPADEFGRNVAISGDIAVLGAPCDDDYGINSGGVYVFIRNGTAWTQQAKLLAVDGAIGDKFGSPVCIDNDTILIGASHDDDNGYDSGSAYVFTHNGSIWTQQAKLTASDGAAGDMFGWSASFKGNTAIIGAYNNGMSRGAAYIFTRSGTLWIQHEKLLASDGTPGDYFGNAVSIDSKRALIGAGLNDDNGVDSGSAYVFDENQPPTAPIITGPDEGKPGTAHHYTITSIDSENDDVSAYVIWGDDSITNWTSFHNSGEAFSVSHSWAKKGTYSVQVKVKDIHDAESGWTTLSVTMPFSYNIPFQHFWERVFDRFPNAFPLLRHMMRY
jgi:hypothetical protein